MGFEIKIDNASVRGLNPKISFIMVSGEDKKEAAQKLFKEQYEKSEHLQRELNAAYQQLLEERGLRLAIAEEQLDRAAEQQRLLTEHIISDSSAMPGEPAERLEEALNPDDIGAINPASGEISVQNVLLCDSTLSVQVGANSPVTLGSIKQFAVFKAVLELSDLNKYDGPCNLKVIGKKARSIEKSLSDEPPSNYIRLPEEVSKICFDLREYCNQNSRLDFLSSLILQPRKKRVSLAGHNVQPSPHPFDGTPISEY